MLLQWIVVFFVGAAAALWAGPRIAPNLPEWASPVARFLTPGTDAAAEAIAEAREATAAEIAALSSRLEDVRAEASAASATSAAAAGKADDAVRTAAAAVAASETRLGNRIEELAASPGVSDEIVSDVTGRLAATEASLDGLRAQVDALTGFKLEGATPSAELLSQVATFGAAVEGLRAEVAALSEQTERIDALAAKEAVAGLSDTVGSIEERVVALEGGQAATAEAEAEADRIRREARLAGALARIEAALATGVAYGEPLSVATGLAPSDPPDALSAASDGAATVDGLLASFPEAAQEAYAADLSAEAGEGMGDRLFARLQGRLGGRPTEETAGDGVGPVLSRIEARVEEGRLAAALEEAQGLSEPARAAMEGWLASLSRTAAAKQGLADWRAALSGQ